MNDHPKNHLPPIEPDRPPLLKLFIFLVGLSVIVVGTSFGLANLLKISTDQEITAKISEENPELQAIRSRDQNLLSTYDIIDEKKGVFRIPIQQAMTILAKHPELIAPMTSSPVRGNP